MGMNLDAMLKITAKTAGREDVLTLNEAVDKLGKSSEKTGEKIEKASEKGKDWKSIAAIAGMVASLTLATKSSVEFETGISDVRKVVDGLDSSGAIQSISQEILNLSNRLPITAEGFAQIYEAAGSSGIARTDLQEFATLVTDVATAFKFTAGEAGTSLAQIKTALGLTIPQLGKLADAMNFVENNTGASARGLVDFMARSAATGKIAGLQATETLAFGAAMTQIGIETEVASTSFNNMIKALSRGPSMTERQVDALRRLGYEMSSAAGIEQTLVREAESASRARVNAYEKEVDQSIDLAERQYRERQRIAEKETDAMMREIAMRYRQLQRQADDSIEDEDVKRQRQYDRNLKGRVDALEGERAAEIRSLKQAENIDEQRLDQINKFYDDKVKMLQEAAEDERRASERIIRDQRERERDAMELARQSEEDAARERVANQQDAASKELSAYKDSAKKKLEIYKQTEQKILTATKDDAKKTGEAMAANSGQGFADRLQKDATGTILEVLDNISKLPQSQQISVLSDLFGDEARGLAPMLSSLDELKNILKLVSKEQQYVGSTSAEAAKRFETSAAKLQIFNNKLEGLKIAAGNIFLPILTGILEPLGALVDLTTRVTQSIESIAQRVVVFKVLGAGIGAVIGPAASLFLSVSAIMSLVNLTKMAGTLRILALIPGPLRAIAIVLAAIGVSATPLGPVLSAISTALLAIQAVRLAATVATWLGALAPFSQLAIAAVTPFLAWMTGTLLPALVGIFSGPVGWIALGVAALVAGVIYFREPIMGFLEWAIGAIGEWWTKVFEFIYATQIEPWVKLWNADLLAPIRKALGGWLDGIKKFFTGIIDYANREWMKPWTDWWINLGKQPEIFLDRVRGKISDLIIFLTKGMQSAAGAIQAAFNNAGQSVARIWNWITRGTANGLNVVIDAYNAAAASANRFPGLKLPILQRMAVPAEIPALARGGHMMAPTLALIGEGGDPGGEYAIPGSRMDAAMAGWAQGLRGKALVDSWQNPGLAPGRSTTAPAAPTTINLTLQQQGPTLQMPDGSQWVTRQEMATTTQAAMEGLMRLMASGPVRANLRIS